MQLLIRIVHDLSLCAVYGDVFLQKIFNCKNPILILKFANYADIYNRTYWIQLFNCTTKCLLEFKKEFYIFMTGCLLEIKYKFVETPVPSFFLLAIAGIFTGTL